MKTLLEDTEKFNRDPRAQQLELLRPLRTLRPIDAIIVFSVDYLGLNYEKVGSLFGWTKVAIGARYNKAKEKMLKAS